MASERALLHAFDGGGLDPAEFSHRDHLRVGWAMLALERQPFHAAYARYRRGLVRLTRSAGLPEKFSETQTLGWLALIHEAVDLTGQREEYAAFEERSGLTGRSLSQRYEPGRLGSPAARSGLLLP